MTVRGELLALVAQIEDESIDDSMCHAAQQAALRRGWLRLEQQIYAWHRDAELEELIRAARNVPRWRPNAE